VIWRAAAWLLALLAAGAAPPDAAAAGPVTRQQSSLRLAPASWTMTPYVHEGSVVVHLQAAGRDEAELLIEARSGQPWAGTLQALSRSHQRLGSEEPFDVAQASDRRPDLQLLAELGCQRPQRSCTSPEDADLVLLMAFDTQDSRLDLQVVDFAGPLEAMSELLAGRLDPATVDWSDDDWRLLTLAARLPRWRERWLDALRSVAEVETFLQLREAYGGALKLGERAMFQGEAGIDLRGELELAGHKLTVRQFATQWLQQADGKTADTLAQALERGARPPSQGRVTAHLVDTLLGFEPAQRQRLAAMLAPLGRTRRSEDLQCFSRWLLEQPCAPEPARPAPRVSPPAPAAAPPTAAVAPRSAPIPAPATAPPPGMTPAPAPAPTPAAPAGATRVAYVAAADAPQEWALISRLGNKLLLFAFDESSGRMARETASLGGLTFVARSLGAVGEGRFELQVSPNGNSPVRLTRGQYRVKARLLLDYTREDLCRGGWKCLLSSAERVAKTERREVVFYLHPDNRWTDRKPASFGNLLPLVADGAARYSSELRSVRLSVESVQVDLQ
jgi:hypothetical protein